MDDKTHEPVGIPSETLRNDIDAIANAIDDSVRPAIYPDIYVQNVGGKRLIVVEVSYGKRAPYYIASEGAEEGAYVRVGATTRHADREWVLNLAIENSREGFDRLPQRGYTVSDEAIEALCEKMHEVAVANRHLGVARGEVRRVTREQLIRWGVLCERDGSLLPTAAFSLLSGDGQARSRIQCAVFHGKTRRTFIDRIEFGGSIIDQFENAYRYILSKLNMGSTFDEGPARRDVYELPQLAVREVVANAVVHRSYLMSDATQVFLFEDRLEVTSPGGIVRELSLPRVLAGASKARNEALATPFAYMNLVEAWGMGIIRMKEEMSRMGLRPPEFEDFDTALRVNLYRPPVGAFGAWLEAGCPDGGLSCGDGSLSIGSEDRGELTSKHLSNPAGQSPIAADRPPIAADCRR